MREFGSVEYAVVHVSMFGIASVAVDVDPNDKTDRLVCRLTMRSKGPGSSLTSLAKVSPGSDLAQRSALNSVAGDIDG
jgi:hypothetical protein